MISQTQRPKLTLEQIESMRWHFPSNKKMAIDYHINGNQYAEYDYYLSLWPDAAEWLKAKCIEHRLPYRGEL